jgi:hypothetical protein
MGLLIPILEGLLRPRSAIRPPLCATPVLTGLFASRESSAQVAARLSPHPDATVGQMPYLEEPG